MVPTILLEDESLKRMDAMVYGVVYWYTRLKNERCTASNRSIASVIGCKVNTVANALWRLNKAGYIEVRMTDKNHRDEIIPLVAFAQIDTPSPTGEGYSPTGEGGVLLQENTPSPTGEQNNNNKKEKEKKMSQQSQKNSLGEKTTNTAPQVKTYSNMDWLTTLNKDDISYFQSRFPNLPESLIVKEALRAHDWLFDKQVVRKDYRAFLRNWLEKTAQNWGNKNENAERIVWG